MTDRFVSASGDVSSSPEEWAAKMSDEDLLDRVRGWLDASLTRACADELTRRFKALQATLVALRPPDGHHHMLCDGGERGGPDVWHDGSQDPFIPGMPGMRAVKFVEGQGLVDDPEPREHVPYVGWCCSDARARQEIDKVLKGVL